jgi:hypothetical protein
MVRSIVRAVVVGILRAAVSGGAALGADDPPAAIRAASQSINDVGNAFGKACGQSIQDPSVEKLTVVRVRYVDCMLLLDELNQKAPQLQVAEGAEGRALKIAYEKWLKVQTDNLQSNGLEYIRIVEDKELTTTERTDKLLPLVKQSSVIEKPFNERLSEAMTAYENRAK